MIYTSVCFNFMDWYRYYYGHKNIQVDFRRFVDFPYEKSFNRIITTAIEEKFDYFFTADPDMTANAKIIEQFVSYDKHAVGALYYGRKPPYITQMWDAEEVQDCKITKFRRFNKDASPNFFDPSHKNRVEGTTLFETDIRSGGYTLVKVDAIKQLNPPISTMHPNHVFADDFNGWDCDIFWRMTQMFGKVFTDLDETLDVKHLGFTAIGEKEENIST